MQKLNVKNSDLKGGGRERVVQKILPDDVHRLCGIIIKLANI